MVQVAISVKNTFVHAEVDGSSFVEACSKARRRSSSTPARVKLDAAESEDYNAHAVEAHGLEDFPLRPHDDDDYSSMHAHPGPSPLDLDVERMMECHVSEMDVDDHLWGHSASHSQLQNAATLEFVNVGIDIVDTQNEEMEYYGVSAHAYHGLTYGAAQLPSDNYRQSLAQHQPVLSTSPMTPHEWAQRQSSTTPISPSEERRDSYRRSHSENELSGVLSNANHEVTQHGEERTTVMLMNMPLRYTNSKLIRTMESEGFAGMYDFIYVPMAAARTCKGYAFVNLVNPSIAQRFISAFDGFSRWTTASKNICQAVWAKQHQGLQAYIDRYRNSTVLGKSVPDDYKPRIFKNGGEVPFPPPNRRPSITGSVGQPRRTAGQQTLSR